MRRLQSRKKKYYIYKGQFLVTFTILWKRRILFYCYSPQSCQLYPIRMTLSLYIKPRILFCFSAGTWNIIISYWNVPSRNDETISFYFNISSYTTSTDRSWHVQIHLILHLKCCFPHDIRRLGNTAADNCFTCILYGLQYCQYDACSSYYDYNIIIYNI